MREVNLPHLDNMCRLCAEELKYKGSYSLYGVCCGNQIITMLREAYGIEIDRNTEMSDICEECLGKLDIVYGIRKEVERCNLMIRALLETKQNVISASATTDSEMIGMKNCVIKLEKMDLHELLELGKQHFASRVEEAADVVPPVPRPPSDNKKRKYIKRPDQPKCYSCLQNYDSSFRYEDHQLESQCYGSESLKCLKCDDPKPIFASAKQWNAHMGYHDEDRHYKCKFCWKRYWTSSARFAHIKSHRRVIAGDSSRNQEQEFPAPKKRKRIAIAKPCDDCGVVCSAQSAMLRGGRVIDRNQEKEFSAPKKRKRIAIAKPCDDCGVVYSAQSAMVRHKKQHHTMQQSYVCDYCDKGFRTKYQLKVHSKSHTGGIECELCHQKFTTLQVYLSHKTHSGCRTEHIARSNFVCYLCDKPVSTCTLLEEHFIAEHPDAEFLYKCDKCSKVLDSFSLYKKHVNQHRRTMKSKMQFECHICHSSTKNHVCVQSNEPPPPPPPHELLEQEEYECKYCYRKFTEVSTKETHERLHEGLKPYKCEICGKAFALSETLKTHHRIHTEAQPFACQQCDAKFGDSTSLYHHIKKHLKSQ